MILTGNTGLAWRGLGASLKSQIRPDFTLYIDKLVVQIGAAVPLGGLQEVRGRQDRNELGKLGSIWALESWQVSDCMALR